MTDNVFRSKVQEVSQDEFAVHPKGNVTSPINDNIEVPYTDYAKVHSHPYLVDHFKLGDRWEDPEGGFSKEVGTIENYVLGKVKSGEVANSVKAIKGVLSSMEKLNNLNHEERAIVKIEVLSNYVEFLQKNEQVKQNLRRYANA